jgi:hypothetical protein
MVTRLNLFIDVHFKPAIYSLNILIFMFKFTDLNKIHP